MQGCSEIHPESSHTMTDPPTQASCALTVASWKRSSGRFHTRIFSSLKDRVNRDSSAKKKQKHPGPLLLRLCQHEQDDQSGGSVSGKVGLVSPGTKVCPMKLTAEHFVADVDFASCSHLCPQGTGMAICPSVTSGRRTGLSVRWLLVGVKAFSVLPDFRC